MKCRIFPVSLIAVILAAVLAPVAVSSPVQAQSQTDWFVNDEPALFGPQEFWYRGGTGHGYGANNYVYTYGIGGASSANNWAHWYMGNRIGRQEIQVYVPSNHAAATVNYNIYIGDSQFKRQVAQQNISGWHSLGRWNANGADVTIAVFDNDVVQHHERDGFASSSIGVDAVTMRCVENCVEPPDVSEPGAPRNLRLTRLDPDSFRIQWDPPSSDGGAAITRYRATISRPAISTSIPAWQNSYTYSSNARSHRFNGRLGATYTVRLVAINRVGASSTTTARHPTDRDSITVPTAPRNLRLTRVDADSFRITWDPPSSNGGARITGYRATLSRPALSSSIPAWERTYSYSSSDRSRIFNGRLGATYTVRLAATNRVGTGPSVRATHRNGSESVPSRVTDVNIARIRDDNNSFVVTWNAPDDNGGAPLTGFVVRVSRPNFTGDGTEIFTFESGAGSFKLVFHGWEAGDFTYRVSVAAKNRSGTGPTVTWRVTTQANDCDLSLLDRLLNTQCAIAPSQERGEFM